MITFLAIIALIISIIVLTIKYIRINAKHLSRKMFEEEARKQAEKLKYMDPVITCDYCGTSIDTGIHATCPSCGASYSDDKEWQRRHATNFDWADSNAEKLADRKLAEAKRKAAKTAKKLKRSIIALAIIAAFFIIIAIFAGSLGGNHYYAESEPLNEYSFDHFIETSYRIDGDNVIMEHDGVKAEISGIYCNEDEYERELKIGYRITNKKDIPICVKFQRCGVNGYSSESSNMIYEWIKAGDTITIYDRLYDIDDAGITSLVYTDIGYHDDNSLTYGKEGYLSFNTTNKRTYRHDVPDGDVVCEKNGVRIINAGCDERGYVLWIDNSSENNYEVKTSDFKINGTTYEAYGIYRGFIPAGHVFKSDFIYSFDTDITQLSNDDELSISLELKCVEDPSQDFSTGYYKLN